MCQYIFDVRYRQEIKEIEDIVRTVKKNTRAINQHTKALGGKCNMLSSDIIRPLKQNTDESQTTTEHNTKTFNKLLAMVQVLHSLGQSKFLLACFDGLSGSKKSIARANHLLLQMRLFKEALDSVQAVPFDDLKEEEK